MILLRRGITKKNYVHILNGAYLCLQHKLNAIQFIIHIYILFIIPGEAAGYILSKGTTFRWDTCAPHAILKAIGGEILDYTTRLPLTYNDPDNLEPQAYCNSGGIIAYGDYNVFEDLKIIFKEIR